MALLCWYSLMEKRLAHFALDYWAIASLCSLYHLIIKLKGIWKGRTKFVFILAFLCLTTRLVLAWIEMACDQLDTGSLLMDSYMLHQKLE